MGQVFHGFFALGKLTGGDDDFVTSSSLPGGELHHMERRAADVEPGDRMNDRQSLVLGRGDRH